MSRPYTGFNGVAGGVTPGLQRLVDYIVFLSGGGLWNNGTYVNRPMRDKQSTSVHATGRAVDLSWRKQAAKGKTPARGYGNHKEAAEFVDFLVANSELLLLEIVIDYNPKPHGRGWRCDRQTWQPYLRPTVAGAPGGDWFHLEISPRMARSAQFYDEAFATIFNNR
jgi:hypothetical protein